MPNADAYPFRTLPAPVRFGIPVAAIGIVFAVARPLGSLIDDASLFLLLGSAVMATAWFAGTGPGLAAVVLGAVAGTSDLELLTNSTRSVETHLALFVLQGVLLVALVAELRRARREAEQRMHDAQAARRESEAAGRMKDEFLATISHELRTPLNAVLGWLHLLRTGKLNPATSSRGLETIERNVRLQTQLTSHLLDMSKALTGKLQLDCRAVSFSAAVQQATTTAAPAAHAKSVTIDRRIPEAPVAVLGDATRLRQIVWHLLANAIKFSPRGGTIGVEVDVLEDATTLTVSDRGPGIDPRFLPRIFDRFTQQDPSPTRTQGGLGVGLSLVRDLVELHGGEIRARNREVGPGAIFTVRLPLQPAESLKDEIPAPPDSATVVVSAPPLDGLRVLVVDHDAEGRELAREVLQGRGAAVRTVATVAEALETLEGWRPDVLVTDTASPDHDSYALVGKVQWLEAERGGRIPAAALTSFAKADPRFREMLADVHCELPKPIEPAVLTAEIARLTGRERRRTRRYH
jgi:signal transduction histidine kinase/CheY-like chemotaxis protein